MAEQQVTRCQFYLNESVTLTTQADRPICKDS